MNVQYTPLDEAETRKAIDAKLVLAGWEVQDKSRLNLYAGEPGIHGIAVREMDTDSGPADYMLFIDGKACGIVEAKREGTTLGDVAQQSRRYALSQTKFIERWINDLPFTYEATNHETRFCDWRDPYARSRNIFHFHRPATLKAGRENATGTPKAYVTQFCQRHSGILNYMILLLNGSQLSLEESRRPDRYNYDCMPETI